MCVLQVRNFLPGADEEHDPQPLIANLRKQFNIENEQYLCFHLRNAKFPPVLGGNYMSI